jgi:hypothetical protein
LVQLLGFPGMFAFAGAASQGCLGWLAQRFNDQLIIGGPTICGASIQYKSSSTGRVDNQQYAGSNAGHWGKVCDTFHQVGVHSLALFLTDVETATTLEAGAGGTEGDEAEPFAVELLALSLLRVCRRQKHVGALLLAIARAKRSCFQMVCEVCASNAFGSVVYHVQYSVVDSTASRCVERHTHGRACILLLSLAVFVSYNWTGNPRHIDDAF